MHTSVHMQVQEWGYFQKTLEVPFVNYTPMLVVMVRVLVMMMALMIHIKVSTETSDAHWRANIFEV